MAIPKPYRDNFDTLVRAAQNGDLALMECTDIATREPRYVLCAMDWDDRVQEWRMAPFGHLCMVNPYDVYDPPAPAEMRKRVYNRP